jgi:hypothetical protein
MENTSSSVTSAAVAMACSACSRENVGTDKNSSLEDPRRLVGLAGLLGLVGLVGLVGLAVTTGSALLGVFAFLRLPLIDADPPESPSASSGGTEAAHRAGTAAAMIPRVEAATVVTSRTGTGITNPEIPKLLRELTAARAAKIPRSSPKNVPITAKAAPSTKTNRMT